MNWTPAFAGVTFQDTFYDIIIILPIIMDDFHAEKVLNRSGNPWKTLSIILNPAKFARPLSGLPTIPFFLRKTRLVARKFRQRRDFRAGQFLKFNRPYAYLENSESGQTPPGVRLIRAKRRKTGLPCLPDSLTIIFSLNGQMESFFPRMPWDPEGVLFPSAEERKPSWGG